MTTAAWHSLVNDVAALEERLARLSSERQAEIHAVLTKIAAQPATIDGIRAAWALVAEALPGLERPHFTGSGEGHNRSALRGAAMQVMTTLVGRCAASLSELDALLMMLKGLPAMKADHLETLEFEAHERFKG